jgi:hypothetical protein
MLIYGSVLSACKKIVFLGYIVSAKGIEMGKNGKEIPLECLTII